jgi:hypothetical protein
LTLVYLLWPTCLRWYFFSRWVPANPVDSNAVSDTASVSALDEPPQDRVDSEALLGLEIDLSDEEPIEAGCSNQSNNLDELDQQLTLTLPDCISVFSSESNDDSTTFDDMSFSSLSDENFGDGPE